jgi:hypothetical protein
VKEDIELSNAPNKKWADFLTKAAAHNNIPVDQWKAAEVLGYFAAKFKEAFGKDYQWKFNTPSPSKSYEVFRLNSCGARLSSKPQILKSYIDWIFDQRVGIDHKSFRSISFLTAEDNINPYRAILFAGQTNATVERTTPLPPNILPIIASLGCKTFGDLAFLVKANIDTDEMKTAKEQLTAARFDFAILDKIV